MIDMKYLREKPEEVKARIKKREMDLDSIVDELLAVDAKKRDCMGKVEAMKAEQNAASKQIPQIKKAGGDASEIMAKMKELVAEIKDGDTIDFICDHYTYDGEFEDKYHMIDPITVKGGLTVSDTILPKGKVRLTYRLTDIYNQPYWTEAIEH